jgi:mannose/fructose/N-acetylgalactosamine-specific phosphotransferase system component IID
MFAVKPVKFDPLNVGAEAVQLLRAAAAEIAVTRIDTLSAVGVPADVFTLKPVTFTLLTTFAVTGSTVAVPLAMFAAVKMPCSTSILPMCFVETPGRILSTPSCWLMKVG